jgi:predicted GIY-YIG superfamily endonuclease
MIDYKNGKIYSIRNKEDSTLVYIGSTCQDLRKRFHQHKIAYQNPNKNSNLYSNMREQDNIDNWYIELYEISHVKEKNS